MSTRGPATVLAEQALRLRGHWRDPRNRQTALDRLDSYPATDPTVGVWRAILNGVWPDGKAHPFVAWLEGDEPFSALPSEFPAGPSPRMLVSSHPFLTAAPWLIQPTSP